MRVLVKLSSSLVISSRNLYKKQPKLDRKRNTGNFFWRYRLNFHKSSFSISYAKFSEFDGRKVILFQIKVFGRNIKETALAKVFHKSNCTP